MADKKQDVRKVTESELIKIMENIINEEVKKGVETEKAKWIAEQTTEKDGKITMLENKITELSKKLDGFISTKK